MKRDVPICIENVHVHLIPQKYLNHTLHLLQDNKEQKNTIILTAPYAQTHIKINLIVQQQHQHIDNTTQNDLIHKIKHNLFFLQKQIWIHFNLQKNPGTIEMTFSHHLEQQNLTAQNTRIHLTNSAQ
jgi:hypothetical protein